MQAPYTNKPIDEDEDEDDITDAYNEATRWRHNFREPRYRDTW